MKLLVIEDSQHLLRSLGGGLRKMGYAVDMVSRAGNAIAHTPAEYRIFEHLVLSRGRVLSKEQLIDAIHDSDSCPGPNVIEVLICTLRKKLEDDAESPIIRTRRAFGYCIE